MARTKTPKMQKQIEEDEIDVYATDGKTATPTPTDTTDPLDHYATDSTIDKSYRAQQEQLDTAKKNAQQSAAVSYELLKKYLPIQNQMNGLSGLGVSESTLIDAHNNYTTQQGQIAQTHAADSAALLENYRAEKTAEQDVAYNEAYSMITGGMYHTFEELDNYLAEVKDDVSPEQYERLENLANYAKDDPTEQERVKEYEESVIPDHSIRTGVYFNRDKNGGGIDNGEVIRLKTGDTEYKVKISAEEENSDVLQAAQKYGKNTAFIYNGTMYVNVGGVTYSLRYGKKEYNELYDILKKKQK